MNILHKGTLKQNKQSFTVTPLSLDHLKQILSVQEVVVGALEKKENLQPLTIEEYEYILQGNGLMIGAFVDKQLIAFRALLVPPIDDEHLGLDIGLQTEELERVIYQEISNVHPTYRGNGMQKLLASVIMEQLKQSHYKHNYVCCTVAPSNIPSLKDKFAQGMEIAALKEKYGGRLRYIFVKELHREGEREWRDTKELLMSNTTGQKQLLAEGYRGYKMEERAGEYFVTFRR